MIFCQKKDVNHVLGKVQGARDHLVSRLLFTSNELQETSFFRFFNFVVIFN